ncbi:MAG: lactate racemase domain-containing protein [Candidatus Thorarchaeota archaeon]|jgi:nickel-dependent lactate racemase
MSFYKTPIKYGATVIDEFIPRALEQVAVLEVEEYKPDFDDFENKLNAVLESPIGSKPFPELVQEVYEPGRIIMFIVDDNTRPNTHTRALLPPTTGKLLNLGVRKEDIKIIIASGSHKKPAPEAIEKRILGPQLYDEWKDHVLIHDCDAGNRALGKTSRGTPIFIDEQVLEASLLIPLSDSEYHYFAGQAGTVKLFCPGVAGRETICVNHPRMFDLERGFVAGCRLGNCVGNPVIEDMIEIASNVKEKLPMFCVDTIVNNDEIVYLQAGDLIECHNAAAEPLRKLRVVEVDEPGDIVFVSVGELGLNLYQAGKGIHAAWNAVRHDLKGWIVLLAPCQEGIGSEGYEEAMHASKDMMVEDALKFVIETYGSEQTFKIGNQKPPDLFRILLDVAEHNIKVVTELDSKELWDVYRMDGINPHGPKDAQRIMRELVDRFVKENADIKSPRVYVLPDAGLLVEVKNRSR